MARFTKSNRLAETEMAYVSQQRSKRQTKQHTERCYFDRIGFDYAMI